MQVRKVSNLLSIVVCRVCLAAIVVSIAAAVALGTEAAYLTENAIVSSIEQYMHVVVHSDSIYPNEDEHWSTTHVWRDFDLSIGAALGGAWATSSMQNDYNSDSEIFEYSAVVDKSGTSDAPDAECFATSYVQFTVDSPTGIYINGSGYGSGAFCTVAIEELGGDPNAQIYHLQERISGGSASSPMILQSSVALPAGDYELKILSIAPFAAPRSRGLGTFEVQAEFVQCGTEDPGCSAPVMLMVYGRDLTKVAHSAEMFYDAALNFWGNGWLVDQLIDPTKEDLLARLETDECVTGLYILAHGTRDGHSGLAVHLNDGGLGAVSAFELGQVTSGRRMASVTAIACNQNRAEWDQSFSTALQLTLPRYTFYEEGEAGTYAQSDWEHYALEFQDWGVGAPPCPSMEKSEVFDRGKADMQARQAINPCPAFLVCDGGVCGHDLYPAVACTSNCGLVSSAQVELSLPDLSTTATLLFQTVPADTVYLGLTRYSAVPADLVPSACIQTPYNVILGGSAASGEIDLSTISLQLTYEDEILSHLGIVCEDSLRVYWTGSGMGAEVAAAIDTVNNEVTYTVPGFGVSCLFARGGPASAETGRPFGIRLFSAFPNPFNPQTTIAFELGRRDAVSLRVFDVSGRLVRVLVDGEIYASGRHETVWNGRDDAGRQLASGAYFYRLEAGDFSETKRLVLVK